MGTARMIVDGALRPLGGFRFRWVVLAAALVAGSAPTSPARGAAWQPPDTLGDLPPQPAGVEVLTRGPLHEAFAEPVVYDPKPGPLVPKEPPAPVEEAPPEQKPEGENVQWIPGYWAWDDTRNDFLWISGLWRDVPPGRQWVPGYWAADAQAFRWVPGAWVATQSQNVNYLPTPPSSLENGPSSPAPSAGAVWSPGYWFWYENRYVWRPGFWVAYQPDWVWVPAHYVWSPGGYLFIDGYWDLPAIRRGTCFAPVYFAQPVYLQPAFVYTPTISLVATTLVSSLFVRPSCHQYYFGDYYAAEYTNIGIYPWFSYTQTRVGFDPVFAHYSTTVIRRDPQWLDRMHHEYRYRREHPEARPPHTYTEMRQVVNRSVQVNNITNVNVTNTNININRNLVLARPIAQIAANPRLMANARYAPGAMDDLPRFTRIDQARRQEITRRVDDLRQFRTQRLELELDATQARLAARANLAASARERAPMHRPNAAPMPLPQLPQQPRRMNLARSPIAGESLDRPGGEPNLRARGNPGGRPVPASPDAARFDGAARDRAMELPQGRPNARTEFTPRQARPPAEAPQVTPPQARPQTPPPQLGRNPQAPLGAGPIRERMNREEVERSLARPRDPDFGQHRLQELRRLEADRLRNEANRPTPPQAHPGLNAERMNRIEALREQQKQQHERLQEALRHAPRREAAPLQHPMSVPGPGPGSSPIARPERANPLGPAPSLAPSGPRATPPPDLMQRRAQFQVPPQAQQPTREQRIERLESLREQRREALERRKSEAPQGANRPGGERPRR